MTCLDRGCCLTIFLTLHFSIAAGEIFCNRTASLKFQEVRRGTEGASVVSATRWSYNLVLHLQLFKNSFLTDKSPTLQWDKYALSSLQNFNCAENKKPCYTSSEMFNGALENIPTKHNSNTTSTDVSSPVTMLLVKLQCAECCTC